MFFVLIEFYLTPTSDQLYIYLLMSFSTCTNRRFEELFGMMQI